MEQRYYLRNRATNVSLFVLALVTLLPLMGWCQNSAVPQLVRTILLPQVGGRLDHMAIDLQGQRLFLAALGNNSLEVIDLRVGKQIRSIGALAEPQGVLHLPDPEFVFVTNGGDGSVRVLEGQRLALLNTVKLSSDADNIRYNAAKREVYVGYGNGALAILDPKSRKQLANIHLDGHPESFQLEEEGTRIFVNVPSANHIAVVDRSSGTVIGKWSLVGARSNYPMALDERARRLFVGCREPARVLVYDTSSGKTVASIEVCRDVDDIFVDLASKRVYVSCGEGFLYVIQQSYQDQYKTIARIPTTVGARTSLFVPMRGRLYLAVPRTRERQAEVRVYSVTP